MKNGKFIALAGAFLASIAISATPLVAEGQGRTNPFAERLLRTHNDARDDVGVDRLEWSNRLARQAQLWADELARRGNMQHSDKSGRVGTGENLWMGHAGYYSAETMVGAFVDERRLYRHGIFPNVSTTGQWRDVGHYTQVIWRSTREVGCAVARGQTDDFLVCHYYPAGNIYDRPVY
ncbi:MAG: CAP family protein [Alteraurantiacibacter sp. bin_em_oilr2.035]|nr:CAP family protein [Aurantiacibacter atlanticus]MDF1835414.1 CAP family protein [Alteraurantiacibacter sp. bin_em_oilr2.035]